MSALLTRFLNEKVRLCKGKDAVTVVNSLCLIIKLKQIEYNLMHMFIEII